MVVLPNEVAILIGTSFAGERRLLRTQLQKIMYFASQKNILEDSFGRGYYGPFSSNVANSTESLVSANFLNEIFSGGYNYSLSKDGKNAVSQLKKEIPSDVFDALAKIVEMCRNRSTSSLSIAAKVHFILRKMGISMTTKQIASQAEKLEWNLSREEVLDASNLLKELGLIEL